MDLTVLNLAIPRISEELAPTSAQLLWILDIYGFLVAGLLITMGTLGDRIGRRKLLLAGAAGFAISSLFAAFSSSPDMLIASRALMGIFGATIAPATLSLIFTMFLDAKQRTTAIGVWVAAYSAGGAIGPVLGGVFLELFWWGSVFLIGVPVMAVLLVIGPRTLPEYRDAKAGHLDLFSVALSLIAILGVVFGLKELAQGGVLPTALAAIGVGVAAGAWFVQRQLRLTSPLIDVRLFRIRAFSASLGAYLLAIFTVVGYFLFVGQYLQLVLGLSPLQAALWSLPSAIGFIVGSTLSPRIIHRFPPSVIMGLGMAIAAAGAVLLLFVGTQGGSGLLLITVALLVMSLALSPVITLATELIVGSAPPEQAGAATGVSETSGELGGALGIALLGSLGTIVYRSGVAGAVPADIPTTVVDAAMDSLGGAIAVAESLPSALGTALIAAAQGAFVDALHVVAALSAFLAILAAVGVAYALRGVPARSSEPEPDVDPGTVATA